MQRYRLYISQLRDLSTLGVLEAFTEEAPQVRVSANQRLLVYMHWAGWVEKERDYFAFNQFLTPYLYFSLLFC